jgi:hypothetical protein
LNGGRKGAVAAPKVRSGVMDHRTVERPRW